MCAEAATYVPGSLRDGKTGHFREARDRKPTSRDRIQGARIANGGAARAPGTRDPCAIRCAAPSGHAQSRGIGNFAWHHRPPQHALSRHSRLLLETDRLYPAFGTGQLSFKLLAVRRQREVEARHLPLTPFTVRETRSKLTAGHRSVREA